MTFQFRAEKRVTYMGSQGQMCSDVEKVEKRWVKAWLYSLTLMDYVITLTCILLSKTHFYVIRTLRHVVKSAKTTRTEEVLMIDCIMLLITFNLHRELNVHKLVV